MQKLIQSQSEVPGNARSSSCRLTSVALVLDAQHAHLTLHEPLSQDSLTSAAERSALRFKIVPIICSVFIVHTKFSALVELMA